MKYQLKTRQIFLFFITFLPTIKLFMLPSVLAKTTNEDMWLSTLLNVIVDGITLSLILVACKRYNDNFYGLLSSHFGKTFANVIFMTYFVYFVLKSVLPVIEQKDYIETTLYLTMPNNLYFVPFFILAFYISTKPLRVWGRLSDVLWFVTVLGFVILIALSLSNVDFTEILPVFANGGKKIVSGSYYSLTWFGDCAYALFFIGNFKWEKNSFIKILSGYFVGALITVFFMLCFYCVFSSISFREQFALTEITKYTTVINNTGRFDYIGIMFLIFSDIFSACLPLYFSVYILNKVFKFKKNWIAPLIVLVINLVFTIFLTEFTHSIEKFLVVYSGAFFLLLGNVLPIIFCLLKPKEIQNEKLKN